MNLRRLSLLSLLFLAGWACQPGDGNANYNDGQAEDGQMRPYPIPKEVKDSLKFWEDYENTNRVVWQKPELVIDLLGNLSNKTVADIGAGTGFFAFRLAPRAEKVIAVDIDQRFLTKLDSLKRLELPEEVQRKLETRLAKPNDPMLAAGEADVVVIVNTFMYIKDQVAYLERLQEAIKPGGRLLIIDFKKKRTPLGPPSDIRVPLFEVEEKLYQAGYKNIITNDTALDYQYIVMAER